MRLMRSWFSLHVPGTSAPTLVPIKDTLLLCWPLAQQQGAVQALCALKFVSATNGAMFAPATGIYKRQLWRVGNWDINPPSWRIQLRTWLLQAIRALWGQSILVDKCRGNETTLRDCQLSTDNNSSARTLGNAVGAACSTATSDTAQYPSSVQSYLRDRDSWWTREKQRQQKQQNQTCAALDGNRSLPSPFRDVPAIQQAFLFPDSVVQTYQQIENEFYPSMARLDQQASLTRMQHKLAQIRWNCIWICPPCLRHP